MKLNQGLIQIAKKAQTSSRLLYKVTAEEKDQVIIEAAQELLSQKEIILKANSQDIKEAKAKKLPSAFIDRLTLDEKIIAEMSSALLEVAKLRSPLGEVIKSWKTAGGLEIQKVRVPIGVIAIIYESRPNVTSDCIGLCFKSGNSVILRGGSESLRSNLAIFKIFKTVFSKHNIPEGAINMIATKDRSAVEQILKMDDTIDLVMPRGGESLIKRVAEISRIPVIKHYKGICHIYVDESADLPMAENICFNAKVQRPGVCNAMESMLVHKGVAMRFLPGMASRFKEAGVELRGCPLTYKILQGSVRKATQKDYHTEYLDLILSVKVVEDLEEAINHINLYGSHHSDSIITEDNNRADEFLQRVDSACVYVNASTRFTDGYQFGMGAEIGISTDKLHARGPMALEELTTYKYQIHGKGQIRE